MTNLAPQPGDDDLDRIRVHLGLAVIDALEQLGPGDDMAHAQGQAGQDPPFERGQTQREAVEGKGAELGIERERATGDLRGGVALPPAGSGRAAA